MKNLLLCLLISCLNCACSRINGMDSREQKAYKIIGNFSKQMQKKGLCSIGTGLGMEHTKGENYGKQNFMSVTFQVDQVLTIESARRLSVETINEFLDCINSEVDFRGCVVEYPYTYKYVSVIIIGQKPPCERSPFVEGVIVDGGFIYYHCGPCTPPTRGLIHKETFEEAVCILQNKSAS